MACPCLRATAMDTQFSRYAWRSWLTSSRHGHDNDNKNVRAGDVRRATRDKYCTAARQQAGPCVPLLPPCRGIGLRHLNNLTNKYRLRSVYRHDTAMAPTAAAQAGWAAPATRAPPEEPWRRPECLRPAATASIFAHYGRRSQRPHAFTGPHAASRKGWRLRLGMAVHLRSCHRGPHVHVTGPTRPCCHWIGARAWASAGGIGSLCEGMRRTRRLIWGATSREI